MDAERESGANEAEAGGESEAAAGGESSARGEAAGGEAGVPRDEEKAGAGDLGSAQYRADDLAEFASEGEDAPPA